MRSAVFWILLLAGCGGAFDGGTGSFTPAPTSCTVSQVADGSVIKCPDGSTAKITNGETGAAGQQGVGAGIVATQASPASCPANSNGGVQFSIFTDTNNNGVLDPGETVTSISVVCGGVAGQTGQAGQNGQNGQAGASSRITVGVAGAACASGGYIFTTQNGNDAPTSVPVCNGANGTNGLNGLNGTNGTNGVDGTQVTPVKFCKSDSSAFPEYGLLVGAQLFAVYWGSTPASNGASQAFLALLTPGSYQSTGGDGCYFVLKSDNTVQ